MKIEKHTTRKLNKNEKSSHRKCLAKKIVEAWLRGWKKDLEIKSKLADRSIESDREKRKNASRKLNYVIIFSSLTFALAITCILSGQKEIGVFLVYGVWRYGLGPLIGSRET